MSVTFFRDIAKVGDKCSVVGNSFIPDHKEATILELNRENGTARVQYTLDGTIKARNIEISQITPPFSQLVTGLADCLAQLVKVTPA